MTVSISSLDVLGAATGRLSSEPDVTGEICVSGPHVKERYDRLWATDLGIPNGLGRHDNDGMFSFYLQTPAGFQVEVGHVARVIDEGWDDDRAYSAISAWGHQPLRQA